VSLGLEPHGQLRGRSRLAGTLEPGQHDDVRRLSSQVQRGALPKGLDQLLLHDLDHLLSRAEALGDLGSHGAFAHAVDQVPHDAVVDIGLQQGHAHVAHRLVDVGLSHHPVALELAESLLELLGKVLEHGPQL